MQQATFNPPLKVRTTGVREAWAYAVDGESVLLAMDAYGEPHLEWRYASAVEVDIPKEDAADQIAVGQIVTYVKEALMTDGSHHKQWYLKRIATLLGVDEEWIEEHSAEQAIAP